MLYTLNLVMYVHYFSTKLGWGKFMLLTTMQIVSYRTLNSETQYLPVYPHILFTISYLLNGCLQLCTFILVFLSSWFSLPCFTEFFVSYKTYQKPCLWHMYLWQSSISYWSFSIVSLIIQSCLRPWPPVWLFREGTDYVMYLVTFSSPVPKTVVD